MPSSSEDVVQRAEQYCQRRKRTIEKQLGAGLDGVVFSTMSQSAVKIFRHKELYRNELAVYQRLEEHDVSQLEGFNVPRLLEFHDELLVIEMEIVKPPFVVDFAGTYLDQQPPYSTQQWEEWEADRRELFESDWPIVQSLLSSFRGIGVYLNDVKPGNITIR